MKRAGKELLTLIGDNVRKMREAKGMSQQELADYADIAKTTLQRIELARMNPSILVLKNISLALEVDLKDLIK